MEKYKNAWTIDVWSLGCIVLEIVTGIPLWMSIPTKVNDSGIKTIGIFAVKGRIFQKIIEKQIEVSKNLDYYLTNCNYSGIIIDKSISDVLKRMLSLEPEQRISPYEILTFFGVDCEPQRIPFY